MECLDKDAVLKGSMTNRISLEKKEKEKWELSSSKIWVSLLIFIGPIGILDVEWVVSISIRI